MEDDETLMVEVRVGKHEAHDEVDLAAAALWDNGATAVEIRSDAAGTTLLAGYPTSAAARRVVAALKSELGAHLHQVTDDRWRDAWKEWMQPVAIGAGLMVAPSWRPVPVGSGRLVLEIDPGSCFGSGTHPSTRMLLAWLEVHHPRGADVVDVGTGSGILAIAAALLGARSVRAVDTDPEAVAATRTNAGRNGVAHVVDASLGSADEAGPDAADLVMVNVTAGTHAVIGPRCARLVRPGGVMLVAGLLPGHWDHVVEAFRPLRRIETLLLDGWEGAAMSRPSQRSRGRAKLSS